MRLAGLIGAIVLVAGAAEAAPARWVGTWGASPAPAEPTGLRLNGQTITQTLRLSVGGDRLRLRLTNEYGVKPLEIGAARIAVLDANGAEVPGSQRVVTFGGKADVAIPAGAPLLSDAVALRVPLRARVRVSLFASGDTGPCTCHPFGGDVAQVSPSGDYTGRAFTAASTATSRAFISGVEVETTRAGPTIVTFGDSITDGVGKTAGLDTRWPDLLAQRLAAQGRAAGVVNAGISGNRVLSEGSARAGQNAMSRFDRDVISTPGATHVILLEGVNDIGNGPVPAQALIDGYRQLIERAHARGIKVLGATILPYEGARYFKPEGEAVRQEVNRWIRSSGAFDGVVDFDAATRDPAQPGRMRADYHSGDWLHPSDAGYRAMADAIDLRALR